MPVSRVAPRVLVAAVLAASPFATSAGPRTMSWRALEVEARLDGEGDLHVRERQVVVFDGDWNGGERRFRLAPGQRLRFERLLRETAEGGAVELARGDLDRVDRYDFTDARTLRWRSRAPSDPPFSATALAYVLEYTLSHVLAPAGDGRYLLRHDFAFPERDWPILAARATLEIDPAWRAEGTGPLRIEAGRLEPGQGLVLSVPLRWAGSGTAPAAAGSGLPRAARAALALAFALALAVAALALLRHVRARGQLAPLPRPGEVGEAFLREHVLSRPPEVIGAAWDDAVGPPEVAAVLARMASEGKLSSRVERAGRWIFGRDVLHLALEVDRRSLRGHEGELVAALFVDGDTIDSDRLREHYRSRGFDPAARIRSALRRRVEALAPPGERPALRRLLAAAAVLLLGCIALAVTGALRDANGPFWLASLHVMIPLPLAAAALAHRLRTRATGLVAVALLLAGLLVAWAVGILWLASGGAGASGWAVAAQAALWAFSLVLVFALGRTPRSAEEIALRKRLAAARAHLARELGREAPRLDDAWTPYLLAFGLGPEVDRWFRAHGSAGVPASSIGGGGGGPGPGHARWTGGGGSFAGGGASGTWAALGAIAGSIPSPSSSSGSGGGGGSGSGGGGGGGW